MKFKISALILFSIFISGANLWAQCPNTEEFIADSPHSPLSYEQLESFVSNIDNSVEEGYETKSVNSYAPYDFSYHTNPNTLIFRTGELDPLKKGSKAFFAEPFDYVLPAPLLSRVSTLNEFDYKIVQFEQGTSKSLKKQLKRENLKIVAYIPENAYIVRVPATKSDKLADTNHIRWTGNYPNGLRFSENLLDMVTGEIDTPDEIMVRIAAFRGGKTSAWGELFEEAGAEFLSVSQNGPGRITLRVPFAAIDDVAALIASIKDIEMADVFELPVLMNTGSIWLLQSGDTNLKFTPLFDVGITGVGQVYAAADSGLDTDACQFRYNETPTSQTFAQELRPPAINVDNPLGKTMAYYVLPGAEMYDETSGGFHGTMTCGCAAGDNFRNLASRVTPGLDEHDGMAPAAKIVFQDVGTKAGELMGLAFTHQFDMNQQAYDSGARTHNNSYGLGNSSVRYDSDSQEIDEFLWSHLDYTNVFAAGNSGPNNRTLGGEGSTSKNTLVLGASMPGWFEGGKDLIGFSSCGYTQDSRIKPDVVAPGLIYSATETQTTMVDGLKNVYGQQAYESRTDPGNNQCAAAMTAGTSFSAPTAAGMTLLVRQYFMDGFYPSGEETEDDGFIPTGALIKAVMINSARALTGDVVGFGYNGTYKIGSIAPPPSTQQGWGRITLDDTLYLKGDRRDLELLADVANDSDDAFEEGDNEAYEIYVKPEENFKVTLVWTDPAAHSSTGLALVNNLNLTVTSPSGKVYFGNQNFTNGFSTPNISNEEHDNLNPLENVFIKNPEEGFWSIEVDALNVPGNGEDDPYDSDRQGYALIASGNLGKGAEVLLPRLSFRSATVAGGCDNDNALDPNEIGQVTFKLLNSGDGTANAMNIEFSVIEDEYVPAGAISFPEGNTFEIEGMEPRSYYEITIPLKLELLDQDLCMTPALIRGLITDTEGNVIEDDMVTIYLETDYNDDGERMCNVGICNPAPQLETVSPQEVSPGDSITLVFEGSYLNNDFEANFDPDVFSYDKIDYISGTTAKVRKFTVPENAEEGPVTITLTNSNGSSTTFEDLLEVVGGDAPDEDGDEDLAETDASEDGSGATGSGDSGGGCSGSGAASLPFLTLLLLGFALLRQKRKSC